MKEIRSIINIGADEEPAHYAKELQAGTVTILVTARTMEEAQALHEQAVAAVAAGGDCQ